MRKLNRRRAAAQRVRPKAAAQAGTQADISGTSAAIAATARANQFQAEGDHNAAIQAYTAAIALDPDHAPALHGLGIVCFHLDRADDGLMLLRRAVALAPDNAEYHNNLGTLLAATRQLEAAIACHHRALRLRPTFAEAHNNLGNALRQYGRLDAALLCFERALALKPDYAVAVLNRGNVLRDRQQFDAALAAYRQASALDPQLPDAHNNLGTTFKQLGRWPEALQAYRAALALAPESAPIHYNLGTALYETGQLDAAKEALEFALARQAQFPEALLNLGNVAKDQGRLEDALRHFEQALMQRPDYAGAHSNLLFTLNYVDGISQQTIFERHRAFARLHATPLSANQVPHGNSREPERRLRIAYVSPDLRAHACAFFLEPLLRHHDRRAVEVFAYAEVAQPDAVTARLRGLVDVWRSTVGISDADMAAALVADRIDILIDLAGHTANNRLLALARKPVPLQISYLGYPASTGLTAMDYRLTDALTEPPGTSEQYYTESLVRLPHSLWCFQPAPDMPAVSASPALANGYVTFGSFNHFAKIGPRVIALWSRVLNAIPTARLSLLCAADAETQARVSAQFARCGVDPGRLLLHGREPRSAYLQRFATVDLALDPFPCNGGTTTCEALWMGLPLIALVGDTFLSRASYSVLSAAGLVEFAQSHEDDYVAACVDLSRDLPRLAALRASLRHRLQASPLLDGALLARNLEAALRVMWRRWCSEKTA